MNHNPDLPSNLSDPDRFFDPDPAQRALARALYASARDLPIVSPHGHVDPRLFADEQASFGTPADLLIIPDHYVFRMLYSQGIPLEALGVPPLPAETAEAGGTAARHAAAQPAAAQQADPRKVWQIFADHFYLFRGTPTGAWLAHELYEVFQVPWKLTSQTAQMVYDHLQEQLGRPEFRPRALFERFNIEVLCTTDAAWDSLEHHQAIRASGWQPALGGNIRPTFRPDKVVNLDALGWRENIDLLAQASGVDIVSFPGYIRALEAQRAFFKSMGATATDHAVVIPGTGVLTSRQAEAIFQRALRGESQPGDAERFTGHMLVEMARMSVEDGLVMQLHSGALRDYDEGLFQRFGSDIGGDIPVATEFTRNLRPLLNLYGSHPNLTLILFTLDESTYARELAPLAGFYPAVKLGPPWWFHDSLNGMRRYFDQVIETAGLYNTAGFNDDTRAFASIPARHDLWRRASANWLASLVVRGMLVEEQAAEMMVEMANGLARRAYKL